jgi:CobQ-like glutamine amidotransferase family enzyme
VPYGTTATITATVNSARPVTGSVQISDTTGNTGTTISLVNGTGTTQLGFFNVGVHILTGQYSGDGNNLPSSTNGSISQVVTGTNQMYVFGSTSILSRETQLAVTIQ